MRYARGAVGMEGLVRAKWWAVAALAMGWVGCPVMGVLAMGFFLRSVGVMGHSTLMQDAAFWLIALLPVLGAFVSGTVSLVLLRREGAWSKSAAAAAIVGMTPAIAEVVALGGIWLMNS